MNSYEKVYSLLVEALSPQQKRVLLLNRLSKKAFKREGAAPEGSDRAKEFRSHGIRRAFDREFAKLKVRTDPVRDVVRAATRAQVRTDEEKTKKVKKIDPVHKATSIQVHAHKKIMTGLSDKETRVFNRAMTTKDSQGNWRSPREARRLAEKIKRKKK